MMKRISKTAKYAVQEILSFITVKRISKTAKYAAQEIPGFITEI